MRRQWLVAAVAVAVLPTGLGSHTAVASLGSGVTVESAATHPAQAMKKKNRKKVTATVNASWSVTRSGNSRAASSPRS